MPAPRLPRVARVTSSTTPRRTPSRPTRASTGPPRAPGRSRRGSTGSRCRCRWTGSRRSTSTSSAPTTGWCWSTAAGRSRRRASCWTGACARSGPGSATSAGSWSPTSTATTSRWRPCWATSSAPTSRSASTRSRGSTCSTTSSPTTAENPFARVLVTAGAADLAELWSQGRGDQELRPVPVAVPRHLARGRLPDPAGHLWAARTLDAVHTPGHTPGHYVFADRADGLLFAGDHVLPTITPSIGFTVPPTPQPLGDFMASLTKVRGPARPADPAGARPGRAVLARPGRRAAGLPREAARALPGRARRRAAQLGAGRRPPRLDPARARLRRARHLQQGHGRDGDQGPPRAARGPRRGDPVGGRRRRGHLRSGQPGSGRW